MKKIFKLGLISAVLLFLLLAIFSALMPANLRIVRSEIIDVQPAQLRPLIEDLRQWERWNLMVRDSLSLPPVYQQDFIRSGNYEVKKTSAAEGQLITQWSNKKSSITSLINYVQHVPGQTTVQWIFDIELGWYPWEKFASLIVDKQLGMPMEQSLDKLKHIAGEN